MKTNCSTWNIPESEPRKRGRGAPSSYSRDKAEKILEALQAGVGLKTAAHWSGTTIETVHAWCKRLPQFAAALDLARSIPIVACAQSLQAYAQDPHRDAGPAVQACRFFLGTHEPTEWTERQDVRLTGNIAALAAGAPTFDLDAPIPGDKPD